MHIHLDPQDLKNAQRMLAGIKDGFPKALYRTLNKTTTGAKTDMADVVRKDYTHRLASVKERFAIYKCPSYETLKSSIRSVGPGVHLSDFPKKAVYQTKKGVMVNVKRATGKKLIPHAFFAPGRKSGKPIVFIRDGQGGDMPGRYPITALYATTPEVLYNTGENWPKLGSKLKERLDKNFIHEVDVVLKGIA